MKQFLLIVQYVIIIVHICVVLYDCVTLQVHYLCRCNLVNVQLLSVAWHPPEGLSSCHEGGDRNRILQC